jgi:uncharacterized protein YPO0396
LLFVRRVDVDEWMGKKGSWDNTYEGTFGEGGVGWKAQAVLGQVKGDRFRHEKNKRKRSTYRGGLIDDNKVNSIRSRTRMTSNYSSSRAKTRGKGSEGA